MHTCMHTMHTPARPARKTCPSVVCCDDCAWCGSMGSRVNGVTCEGRMLLVLACVGRIVTGPLQIVGRYCVLAGTGT